MKSAAVRRFGWRPGGWSRAPRMLSGGPDGEGVEVVGQDAPGHPCAGAVVAFEAAALEAVAALEVADAALRADPVTRQAAVAAPGAGALAAGDERPVRRGKVLSD